MESEIAALCRGVGRIYGDWYKSRARVLGEYLHVWLKVRVGLDKMQVQSRRIQDHLPEDLEGSEGCRDERFKGEDGVEGNAWSKIY